MINFFAVIILLCQSLELWAHNPARVVDIYTSKLKFLKKHYLPTFNTDQYSELMNNPGQHITHPTFSNFGGGGGGRIMYYLPRFCWPCPSPEIPTSGLYESNILDLFAHQYSKLIIIIITVNSEYGLGQAYAESRRGWPTIASSQGPL